MINKRIFCSRSSMTYYNHILITGKENFTTFNNKRIVRTRNTFHDVNKRIHEGEIRENITPIVKRCGFVF